MIVYVLLAYTFADIAFDIWRSRRVSRETKCEQARYNLIYLLYKLDVKAADPVLEELWQRRMYKMQTRLKP